MDASQRKELLHLRIEQANEEMQLVLSKMIEALFQAYQPDVLERPEKFSEKDVITLPPPASERRRMTMEESIAELKGAIAECERGDFMTAAELEKDMAKW